MEFEILMAAKRAGSKHTALDFGLFRKLLDKVSWE